MYLQEFKIYLIGGHMLKAAEDVTIPAEHRLLYRFKNSDITRLNHFIDGAKGIERETAVICFPEQAALPALPIFPPADGVLYP